MAFGCRTKVPKSALARSQYHVVCKHSCCGTVVLTGDDMKTATVKSVNHEHQRSCEAPGRTRVRERRAHGYTE